MSRTNRILRWAVAVCAAMSATTLLPGIAVADSVAGTRSEELTEVSHRIELTMDRGFATLVVRRNIFNGGERHDQATFDIELPTGAAATGLRTLGLLDGRPHWFSGDLLEAETAAARYKELTGIGGYYPKDPALLSWRWSGHLALQVFPCAPGANKTIEYTLLMPTRYEGGRHHLKLPRIGTERLAASLAVRTSRASDRLLVGDKPVQSGTELGFSSSNDLDIALEPSGPPTLEGALAVMALTPARVVSHARLDVARKLSSVPPRARVVVLLDSSRSLDDADRAASVATARVYLSNFPDASAEVIAFDREARPQHGRLVPVATALQDLGSLSMRAGNGSAVDRALDQAAALTAAGPGGERRVLIISDALTRSSLSADQLRRRFGSARGIVHVAIPTQGTPALYRDDDHDWVALSRATGGLVWRAAAGAEDSDGKLGKSTFEELARPIRLHHVSIKSPGFLSESFAERDTLAEGEGLSELRLGNSGGAWFSVEGELWTRQVRTTVNHTDDEKRRWSALVFGDELHSELSEAEMMVLAKQGGAVSPVTSYLAIEPGVRPSTEGLDDTVGEGFGAGGLGFSGSGTGGGGVGSGVARFDHEGWLREALAPAWTACGGKAGTAHLQVETTYQEIVDVLPVEVRGASDPKLGACLAEAVWKLELPEEFRAMRASYGLDV